MSEPNQDNRHKLSVIIPIFNEPRISGNLKIIDTELTRSFSDYEIICVDDGSQDTTLKRIKQHRLKHLRVFSYPMNVGKGFALVYGFSKAKGDIIAFIDSDLELHPNQLRIFSDLMDLTQSDIVVGSKRHPLSQVKYPFTRRTYSFCYQLLLRLLFGLNITDTQVGIKLFRRKVLEKVLPRLMVKRWAFDVEVLVVAHQYGFNKIIEAPIKLNSRFKGSKIDFGAARNIVQDTLAIFYRKNFLNYYNRK